MKKNKGFMLAETLIVTTFVSGILVFLFIQFSSLSSSYDDSYKYNTVENLYSLKNIRTYILNDINIMENIETIVDYNKILDITDCKLSTDTKYCKLLFEVENIEKILISQNNSSIDAFSNEDEKIKTFVKKINQSGSEKYRIIAVFKDNTFATIRFGD